jgi:ribosome-associated toxin RatA of RatAB toxin-antitoxin module
MVTDEFFKVCLALRPNFLLLERMRAMMMRYLAVLVLSIILSTPAASQTLEEPPPGALSDYGLEKLHPQTMVSLMREGAVVIVRQRDDMTLINVTVGRIVDAPMQLVWSIITDYKNYPDFMTRFKEQRILERQGQDVMIVEQTVGFKFWRLPAINSTNKLVQKLYPPNKVRFWHIDGLPGTYGGWDLVPVKDRTMIFYTLFSNFTKLGWGIGNIFETDPGMMTGINTTTAMMITKSIKEESERRLEK